MKKGVWGILIVLTGIIIFSGFMIFSETSFAATPIDAVHLEELRFKAQVGCLQNSQCSNGSECVNNACVDNKEIDLCQSVSLSTTAKMLKTGDSINSAKRMLAQSDLPYLLTDGRIDEIIKGNLTEHLYSPAIFIGSSKIEKDNSNYAIASNEPLYVYKLLFSKGVDFSSKNIRGQSLRILGNEYIIGDNSDNSHIYLVSDKNNIELQNKNNVKITRDDEGNVILIEISVYPSGNLKTETSFSDSSFNAIKFSFNFADDNSADVNLGGSC